jgi:uncharacterized paraquat-inducible protein A
MGEQQDDDELTACPRCSAPVQWVTIPAVPREQFAVCTRCTWGED